MEIEATAKKAPKTEFEVKVEKVQKEQEAEDKAEAKKEEKKQEEVIKKVEAEISTKVDTDVESIKPKNGAKGLPEGYTAGEIYTANMPRSIAPELSQKSSKSLMQLKGKQMNMSESSVSESASESASGSASSSQSESASESESESEGSNEDSSSN